MIHALCLVLASCPQAGEAQAPAVPAERIAAVAEAVAQALPPSRRIECHVSVRNWNHLAKGAAPNLAKDAPFMQRRYTFRMFGPERTVFAHDGYAHVQADGFHYGVATGERSAFVDRGRSDPSVTGIELALQLDTFAPFGSHDPAPEVIRTSTPLSLTADGPLLTYRFITKSELALANRAKAADPISNAWQREIVVDTGDPPRIMGWSLHLPSAVAGAPSRVDRWRVEEWQVVDGRPLARRIRREVDLPKNADTWPDGGIQIQLTEISDLAAIPADVPTPRPVAEGTRVIDKRAQFEFVAGSTDIVYKGRELRLKDPLWAHPGDALDELMKGAVER